MGIVRRPLNGIFEYGEKELANAKAILDQHEPTQKGTCTCDRPWPCNVADFAAEWAAYWECRLEMERKALRAAIDTPTMPLPTLAHTPRSNDRGVS